MPAAFHYIASETRPRLLRLHTQWLPTLPIWRLSCYAPQLEHLSLCLPKAAEHLLRSVQRCKGVA